VTTLASMAGTPHPLVQTDLPPSVAVGDGEGGLPRLRVSTRAAQAEVYLHGAHVTSWTPAGHADVLWVSRASWFAPGAAIRGGVPICFPWFGAHPTAVQAPSHGFARLLDWALVDAEDDGADVVLTLRLTDSEPTRASAWPHPFRATYRVTVGAALSLSLDVTNTGEAVSFEEALHTYYAVRDTRSVTVTGLDQAAYVDRLGGPEPRRQGPEPVRFEAETDRIYLDTRATTTVVDPGHGRSITTRKAGSDATVVWNPWSDKARALRDLDDDEWTGMCCVETCNVRDSRVRLDPGGRHTMSATTTVESLG
jgi:glucose-6-phosphate 1-epimerase